MKSPFLRSFLAVFVCLLLSGFVAQGAAPSSVAGHTFYVKVTDGGHPFSDSGSFLLVLSDSGLNVRIVNMADVPDNLGVYSYKASGPTSEITIGDMVMTFVFTNTTRGVYQLIRGGSPANGYQTGHFVAATGSAPSSLANQVIDFTGVLGDNESVAVKYRLVVRPGSYVRIEGGVTSASSTLNYNLLNESTGQIYFKDSVMGEGLDRLVFASATNGFFAYKIGTGRDYEIGRFTMQALAAPTVLTQPQDQQVVIGSNATFSVVMNGTRPFQFQWRKNEVPIPGATQSTLRISSVQTNHVGTYSVLITNLMGFTLSSNALLTTLCPTVLTSSNKYIWLDYNGGDGSVGVTSGCEWIIRTTNSWITILSETNQTGDGTVDFSVDVNTNGFARTGFILIGNRNFMVAQGPAPVPANLLGKTLTLTITSGTALPSNGKNIIAASSGSTNYISSQPDSTNLISGTYVFTNSGLTTANLVTASTNIALTFSSPISGTFSLTTGAATQSGQFVLSQRMGDLNFDGREDLFWHKTDGLRMRWLMIGTNTEPQKITVSAVAGQTVGMADFNRDGVLDLLYQDPARVLVLALGATSGSGTVVTLRSGLKLGEGWRAFAAHDLNRDGNPDVLLQNADGRLGVWKMNGTNFLGSLLIRNGHRVGTGWRAVGMNDMNGDREEDLLFHHNTLRQVSIWYFNAGEFVSAQALADRISTSDWRLRGIADLNYDGHHDFLWQHNTIGFVSLWHMNGTNVLTKQRVLSGTEFLGTAWRLVGPK